MKLNYFIRILLLIAIILITGCISNLNNLNNISQIKSDPKSYENKEVILEGTVTKIVSTANTPPIAGAKFGTQFFMVNDGTNEIMIGALLAENIDESLTNIEQIPRYNNQESIKIIISEGDKLKISGVVEYLPNAQELTKITIKANRIERK